jgi:hypothetical protein
MHVHRYGDPLKSRWDPYVIVENLDRAELTVQQRAEHIAEWIELCEERVSAQPAPKPQGGRPESGINAAVRELGIERTDAQLMADVYRGTIWR